MTWRDDVLAHYAPICRCEWVDGPHDDTRMTTSAKCVIHGGAPDPLDALLAALEDAGRDVLKGGGGHGYRDVEEGRP